jgi:hypothetical protein
VPLNAETLLVRRDRPFCDATAAPAITFGLSDAVRDRANKAAAADSCGPQLGIEPIKFEVRKCSALNRK